MASWTPMTSQAHLLFSNVIVYVMRSPLTEFAPHFCSLDSSTIIPASFEHVVRSRSRFYSYPVFLRSFILKTFPRQRSIQYSSTARSFIAEFVHLSFLIILLKQLQLEYYSLVHHRS